MTDGDHIILAGKDYHLRGSLKLDDGTTALIVSEGIEIRDQMMDRSQVARALERAVNFVTPSGVIIDSIRIPERVLISGDPTRAYPSLIDLDLFGKINMLEPVEMPVVEIPKLELPPQPMNRKQRRTERARQRKRK